MKLTFLILAAAASLGLAAQSGFPRMTAKVPFAFEMNGKQMPAGSYDLQYTSDRPYATVRHAATGRAFLFEVRKTSGVRLDRSAFSFDRRADRYILTAVSDRVTGYSIVLPRGRAAREMANNQVTSVAVTVAE